MLEGWDSRHRWGNIQLMVMDYMIWLATFGNGAVTGRTLTITTPQLRTRWGHPVANGGCCGAGPGTAIRMACVSLAAAATLRLIGATISDFDVCQDWIDYT